MTSAEGAVLAGPWHPAFGYLVFCAAFLMVARRVLKESGGRGRELGLGAPENVSRMRGMRNANCELLKQNFGFSGWMWPPDPALAEDEIGIRGRRLVKV